MFPDCRQELYSDLVTIMGYWLEDEGQISIHVHYFKEITPWSKSFILKKYSSEKKISLVQKVVYQAYILLCSFCCCWIQLCK